MTGILSVLLLILKILGIILLSVLGLILLIILVILFVPVRYSIRARKDETGDPPYFAKAKVTWLLHIVNVLVNFPSEELVRIRICFFKVFPSSKKEKPVNKKENAKEKTSSVKEDNQTEEYEDLQFENEEPEDLKSIEKPEDNYDNKVKEPEKHKPDKKKKPKKEKKRLKEKINDKIREIKDKINGLKKKASDIKYNIDKYIEIYNSDEFQASFALCKKKLLGILKSILPKKIKGKAIFGKENAPDTVGMVYSLYSVLYSRIGKSFILYPEFERDILTGDVIIKGRIFIFILIFAVIRIYFDKNVKKLLKMLKKEKKNG